MPNLSQKQPLDVSLYRKHIQNNRYFKALFRRMSWLGYKGLTHTHSKMFPFSSVRKGDTVFQVGCISVNLYESVSHPLIYSSLVGETGKVYVFEPDEDGFNNLTAYCNKFNIKNIYPVKKALWDEKTVKTFVTYPKKTGANALSDARDNDAYHKKLSENKKYSNVTPIETKLETSTIAIQMDELGIDKVNHVNITTNGAEVEIIRGAGDRINNIDSFSFVFVEKRVIESDLIDFLEQHRFKVVLQHFPIYHQKKLFLMGLAVSNNVQMTDYSKYYFDSSKEESLFTDEVKTSNPQDVAQPT